jgi:hypothetical protein
LGWRQKQRVGGAGGAGEGSKGMFEQAAIAVKDEQNYARLHAVIEKAFGAEGVEVFLDRVTRAKLRIRDYEAVLKRGLLGKDAVALYEALPVSDQALTRERYLWLVEQVPGDLRQRYFRLYAYY